MKQLTHIRDGVKVGEYLLDVDSAILGRGTSAQVRLDENRIVSRQHAVVRRRTGVDQHVVEDLGGANGTFVNDFRIEVHILRPGDRIVLGEDTLRYDFATRNAVSLRATPPPREGGLADLSEATASAELEELPMAQLDVVDDLAEVREERRRQVEAGVVPGGDQGEHTRVADKHDLERLLALMVIKAKPHFVLRIEGRPDELIPLGQPPVRVGHSAACAIRLPGFKIMGRVAATLVQQAGGWCLVPESTFWNPVVLGDGKLTRIRQLEEGDELQFRGGVLFYHRGEAR
jgi:hypothetical protein